ncbi:MAG: thioredoxin family protein [Actinomycetota bacterium]
MVRILTVVGAMIIALVVSWFLRRRQVDAPTQGGFELPVQLDRNDFASPEAPWIVVVFTSATCGTCNDVATKAEVLASRDVAVVRVDYTTDPQMHARYKIEAVPTLVIADSVGVVKSGFLGPVKAQDLWAAVAECREPGTSPGACQGHAH